MLLTRMKWLAQWVLETKKSSIFFPSLAARLPNAVACHDQTKYQRGDRGSDIFKPPLGTVEVPSECVH
jgi:hypothetical protein